MLDEIGGSWDVDSRSNCDGIHRRADATATADQLGQDAVPVLRNYAAENATHCTNCDWTLEATKPAEPKASDAMAILLSIIPGLGHIYKGHRMMGAFILFLITPLAIVFAVIAAVASAGWGILMLIPYWGAVMLHVWAIDDRVTSTPDEGEQYRR